MANSGYASIIEHSTKSPKRIDIHYLSSAKHSTDWQEPNTLQRWINETLMEYIDICCIVYLDDVLIFSNNLQQHQQDVRNILKAIRKSGMKVKPSKCEFHKKETEYLGFIISREGIKTDPVKTQAIDRKSVV